MHSNKTEEEEEAKVGKRRMKADAKQFSYVDKKGPEGRIIHYLMCNNLQVNINQHCVLTVSVLKHLREGSLLACCMA